MQIISNDKIVRSNILEDLKHFNFQILSTQAKKGDQLVSMTPAIKKAFNLMGDDVVELHAENESIKKKTDLTMKNGLKDLNQDCYNRSKTKKEQF